MTVHSGQGELHATWRRWLPALLALLVIAGSLALSASWMHRNGFFARPPFNDAAWFRVDVMKIHEHVVADGLAGWFRGGYEHGRAHPPGMLMVAAAFVWAHGGDASTPTLWWTTVFYAVVLGLGAYRLARNFGGPWLALGATALTFACPVVIVTLRGPLWPQMPMTAVVLWALDALVRTRCFTRPGWSVAFGVLVGLATLTKMLAPLYMIGSAVLALALGLRERGRRGRVLASAALTLVAALGVMSLWYGAHWRMTLKYATGVVGPAGQQQFSRGLPIASLERWTYYPRAMFEDGFGAPLALVVIAALLALVIPGGSALRARGSAPRARAAEPERRRAGWVLVAGVAVALVALVFGQVHGRSFYLHSFAPLGAIAVACAIAAGPKRVRGALALLVAAIAIWTTAMAYRGLHTDVAVTWRGIDVVPRADMMTTAHAIRNGCEARPEGEPWPNAHYVARMAELARAQGRDELRLGAPQGWLLHPFVNPGNLEYEARRAGRAMRAARVAWDAPLSGFGATDFLLLDSVGLYRSWGIGRVGDVLLGLRALGFEAEIVEETAVTPRSTLWLVSVRDSRAEGPFVAPSVLDEPGVARHDVVFDNGWRLVGTRVRREGGALWLTTFWDAESAGPRPPEAIVNLHFQHAEQWPLARPTSDALPLLAERPSPELLLARTTPALELKGHAVPLRFQLALRDGGRLVTVLESSLPQSGACFVLLGL